jgi:asparagine synthase (glutamine-hydrolysing)
MCGLVVSVSFDGQPADRRLLERMAGVIRHRGPDDSGVATYGPLGFAFRRLSILDLSPAGHQPMETPDGRLSVVFNGEIYNYIELRDELRSLGHTFRTGSDTEVLLHAYDQWGTECAARFNGMWAFALYDASARKLLVSRDRFGVKPLYRYRAGDRLLLASEIKAILASGEYRAGPNWRVASKFLHRGHLDEDTETFYDGIDQIEPGTTVEIDLTGKETVRRFWRLPHVTGDVPADPIATFRGLFESSVALRMRSDVPVGVCLSGGIDSNAIISMMASLRAADAPGGRLQAFSYIPDEFSEAEYIEQSVAQTGAELNVLHTTPRDLWDLLPRAMWHYDEPVHSATALIGFKLMELAKSRGVTVVLNGQGADEVNAGYPAYFPRYWLDLFRDGRFGAAFREIAAHSRVHQRSPWPVLWQTTLAWLGTSPLRPRRTGPEQPGDGVPVWRQRWFDEDLRRSLPPRDTAAITATLEQSLTRSVEINPLPTYLRVEDRNSMAHSVEARVPFLDYRLVTLAFSIPHEWKLRGPWNKYLVREAMRGTIAEGVRTRVDKMGFPTPARSWFAGAWYEPMQDLLSSRRVRENGALHVEKIRADLERHRAGAIDASSSLFHVAEFAAWCGSRSDQAVPTAAAAAEPV